MIGKMKQGQKNDWCRPKAAGAQSEDGVFQIVATEGLIRLRPPREWAESAAAKNFWPTAL